MADKKDKTDEIEKKEKLETKKTENSNKSDKTIAEKGKVEKNEKVSSKTVEKKEKEVKKVVKKDSSKIQFIATGRRKKAIARVRLIADGKGNVIINKTEIDDYFPLETLKLILRQPLALTNTAQKFDIIVNVKGGGLTGQAGAICHGIARALVKSDETLKSELKKAGLLTRDSRTKERKKYGLKKARKAPQFSKR